MGCDFFQCENCLECCCDFGYCSICEEQAICMDCIETQKKNNYIYNVIYCKDKNDKYGNLDYMYICDGCLLLLTEEQINQMDINKDIKEVLKNFNYELLLDKANEQKEKLENKLKIIENIVEQIKLKL